MNVNSKELREKFIRYFERNGHTAISGKSLIPDNDPTVLFTTAGMHPLVPYLLGKDHPSGNRLVNWQKCIRTGDIDEVGDNDHLTFFEMLGNWSIGDYFKEKALRFSWEFLTDKAWLGIDPDRLSVSVFAGDEHAPRDDETARIWRSLGVASDRIFYLGRHDNWWGPAGKTGPCGPDSEMFIDTGIAGSSKSRPGYPDGKYVEIWNDVFLQYNKMDDGTYAPLARHCVDTGMGLERTVAILQGKRSAYDTDLFQPIIAHIKENTGKIYGKNVDIDSSIRIISDHIKAAVFILGDEQSISPSNVGAGYILRRLIRRGVRHARKLSQRDFSLCCLVDPIIAIYRDYYPLLSEHRDHIVKEIETEERQFIQTLKKGEREFDKIIAVMENGQKISGEIAFRLYDTFGFPIELTLDLAEERGINVDIDGFQRCFQAHQEISRSSDANVFKGGLADHSEATTRLHSATHLLHQALRDVLGSHIAQKGSNITADRLRFDFSHGEKMTKEQIERVERIVNLQIQNGLPVVNTMMPLKEARRQGAIALFSDKYQEVVSTYRMGEYSFEVCGGPHVRNTSEIGRFHIVKEQSSSKGVRRIKAVLEPTLRH